MKPLKLTMSAFGSYGNETVIDFTTVDHGLFLITGDTGSGKTTIFDGITFAIYGETSGGKRDGKMMRSQFASAADETFVELEFSYRGEIYKVRRSPEYLREKKRGNGLVKAAATVELTMPDGTAYRGKVKETDKKLCEIMGIDREQFTQIAMIAQGDFLRLLHAKSEDRKKIFSTIFHTGLYRRVEEELGEKRKELKNRIDGADERMKAYVQSAGMAEEGLPEGESRPDLKGLRERLESLLSSEQEKLQQVEEPLRAAEQLYGQLREKRGHAKNDNDALDAYEHAVDAYKKKLESETEYLKQRGVIQKAERAYQVMPFYDRVKQCDKQVQMAVVEERESRAQRELAFLSVNDALETLDAENGWTGVERNLQNWETQDMTMWISDWKAEVMALEAARKKQKELTSRESRIVRRELEVQKKSVELEIRFQQMTLAREKYGNLQEQFLREQAGILAKERLIPGMPCPVCGSLEHPAPAVLALDAVTEVQVKNAQKEWEQIRTECEEMSLTVREERVKVEEEKRQMEDAKKEIPEKIEERLAAWNAMIQVTARFMEENERLKKAMDTCVRCEKAFEEARAEYAVSRSEVGFDSKEEHLSAVSTWKTKAQLESAKKECEAYFLALQESKTAVETLKQRVVGKQYTDLSVLDQELEQRQEKVEAHRSEKERILQTLKNHERLLETVQKEESEYAALLEEFLLYDGLWQAAGGKLRGQVRLDFETYVQRMYFERILSAANKRFLVFTNGKMKLKSRPLDEVGLMGAAGLELNVYVMATGKERDVKTLSGGESFLASLALALGLSDVVQSQAGSVHLESMFVDEGFGALDDAARDQAMRVLNDLAGDERLVGIISHVNTLKDSIERKLMVKRTLNGSTVSWS